jgi:peptidoglycan/LPS O-acetylase OafA/YrhL
MSASASRRGVVSPPTSVMAETERFLLLDGLRGIAAFAVIFDHVPSGAIGDLIPQRYLAVDFFFVLSGFVLAHAYGPRLSNGWSPLSFMRARFIRLYPLYLAGLLIGLSFTTLNALRGWGGDLSEIFSIAAFGVFFLPMPPIFASTGGQLYPLNAASWSLFFELAANFVYALIARFLNWRVLAAILLVSAVLVVVTLSNHADVRGPGWLWSHFDAGLARVVFDFFAGIAIYRLWTSARIPALPWWLAIAAFLVVIAFPVSREWAAAYDALAAIAIMPVLVAVAAGSTVSGRVAKVCGVFGLLSYGIYVFHGPIFGALMSVLPSLHIDLGGTWMMVALVAALAASAAAIADGLYDRPFRKWLTRVLPGRAKCEKTHTVTGEHG